MDSIPCSRYMSIFDYQIADSRRYVTRTWLRFFGRIRKADLLHLLRHHHTSSRLRFIFNEK